MARIKNPPLSSFSKEQDQDETENVVYLVEILKKLFLLSSKNASFPMIYPNHVSET